MEPTKIMEHIRATKTYTMILSGMPECVFSLLCPVREYEWIESWRCEMIFSNSGRAELDCIFRTDFPDEGPAETWVVSKYQPYSLIEFVRMNSLRAIRYTIELRATESQTTEATWTQVITGLNQEGDRLVQSMTDEEYAMEKVALERMLNHYLLTGRMLSAADAQNHSNP
jgi:hypothetical protein